MEKISPNDLIILFVCGLIIGVLIPLLQPILDSWTIVQEFIVASVFLIAGWLMLWKSRNKTGKRRQFYHSVGFVAFAVGIAILIMPLVKRTMEWIVA